MGWRRFEGVSRLGKEGVTIYLRGVVAASEPERL